MSAHLFPLLFYMYLRSQKWSSIISIVKLLPFLKFRIDIMVSNIHCCLFHYIKIWKAYFKTAAEYKITIKIQTEPAQILSITFLSAVFREFFQQNPIFKFRLHISSEIIAGLLTHLENDELSKFFIGNIPNM